MMVEKGSGPPVGISVSHDPVSQRFIAVIDGQESTLDYDLANSTMTIASTLVPPSLRSRGIAGAMTRVALETARRHGWKVVPECPYAANFLMKHPEYHDLLARQL
ncbi:MAG TPA: GNAT family N-acetyltransferase [Rhodanobacteraceae bacterium]|nr:GNAT family N-acetyltransferase [Rhodanobacteraceae bacterium]